MSLNKWAWFNKLEISTVLVNSSLKHVFIDMVDYNIELQLYSKAINISGLIFPISFVFEKHQIIQKNILFKDNIFLCENKWVCKFFICSNQNIVDLDSEVKLFDFETTLMFSEYINNIVKIIKLLKMKFIICFAGEKNGEFNLEFYLPKSCNLIEIIFKLGILRVGLEEIALNRGLIVKQIQIIQPINCFINNSLFKKFLVNNI